MKTGKGFSLVGLIVVLVILGLLFAVLLSMPSKALRPSARVYCGTNLKGLGTAMAVYANENKDFFPVLPGKGPWSDRLGFEYDMEKPDFSPEGEQGNVPRTITASWYILVRYADVSPKSFTCPLSKQVEFSGQNPKGLDIVQLWDFGSQPFKHVSYAMHNPYGRFPADATRSAAFAMAADMNPWFVDGQIVPPGRDNQPPQITTLSDPATWKLGNALSHKYEGQNVLYGDGHSEYRASPNAGVKNDNIYTYWSKEDQPNDEDVQGGTNLTGREQPNDAKSKDDSFLGI